MIDPFETDEQTTARDTRLYRRQARADFLAAEARGGIDAAINASKHRPAPSRAPGFRPIPGASRTGALDPSVKTRMLRREAAGEVQLDRAGDGRLIGFREVNNNESKEG